MRRGGRVLILLGIILGVVAAGFVFFYLGANQPQQPAIPTKPVVIAAQNIGARSEISINSLAVAEWPENAVPAGAFQTTQAVAGKLALDSIYQGEIILLPMIVDKTQVKETRSNASFVVPDGKVAIAFQITPLTGIANALQAGDTIDMLLTLQPGPAITGTTGVRTAPTNITGTEGQGVTQTALQDVLILNIGNWTTGPQTPSQQQQQQQSANIITLALSNQDALVLKAAREQGQIDLVLRKAGDHRPITTEPVNLEYLNRRFKFDLRPALR